MVIDPTLEDKVRVTVIATGFGAEHAKDDSSVTVTSVASQVAQPMQSLSDRHEIPSFARKQKEGGASEVIKLKKLSVLSTSEDEEKFDIPTFLRKQQAE
jgi:cell division GTPase FtsZ